MISSINAMLSYRCLLEVCVETLGRKLARGARNSDEASTLEIQVSESAIRRLALNPGG